MEDAEESLSPEGIQIEVDWIEKDLWGEGPDYHFREEEPYPLETNLVRLAHGSNPLYLRLPAGWEKGDFFWNNYHYIWQHAGIKVQWRLKEVLEKYERGLKDGGSLREGSVEPLGDDLIRINLGIRRSPKPSEKEVAKGTYYYGLTNDGVDYCWTWLRFTERFYRDLIHPYVFKDETDEPIEWATKRAQLAISFGLAMGVMKDFPPDYAQSPFKRLAPDVCNNTPECLLKPRDYYVSEKEKSLLAAAEQFLREELCPELVCFILENSEFLSEEFFQDNEVLDFLKKVADCLENGLVIDRVSDLFKSCIEKGVAPKEALKFTLDVVVGIYGGEEKPWWFKEDFDLTIFVDDSKEKELVRKIACRAGFAFAYAYEIYKSAGNKLLEIDGISEDEVIEFLSVAAKDFGIGNMERACNVVNFAVELLNDVVVPERAETLKLFEKYIHSQRPSSEIIGKLEGSEAIFNFPGLYALVDSSLGTDRIREEKLDRVTIRPEHLRDMAEPLSKPLQERAKTPPTLAVPIRENRRLLAANLEGRLLLPVPEERRIGKVVENPLPGVFQFYEQLRKECGGIDEDVADLYFAFAAQKMPDPFKPMSGILKFLQEFEKIPTPGYRFSGFEGPQNREYIAQENAKLYVEKNMVVSNLLDAWVMGLLSTDELFEIFNWMTESAPDWVRKIFEKEEIENEEEEDFVRQNVDSRISELETWIREKRMEIARDAIEYFVSLNIYVILGVVKREDLIHLFRVNVNSFKGKSVGFGEFEDREALKKLEEDMKKDKYDVDEKNKERKRKSFLGEDVFSKFVSSIQDMISGGFFKPEIFRRILKGLSPDEGRELLLKFYDVVRKFKESVDQIEASDKHVMDSFFDEARSHKIDFEAINRVENRLRITLNAFWDDIPEFMDPDIVESLIGTYLKASAYIKIYQTISDFRKSTAEAEPGFIDSEKSQAVRDVTSASMSIIGTSVAFGDENTRQLLGVSDKLPPLLKSGDDDEDVVPVSSLPQRVAQELSDRLVDVCPQIKEWICEVRMDCMGLVPVGGKIHVLHPVDKKRFEAFRLMMGLRNTPFQLQHANTSLILPAIPSCKELAWIVAALEKFGVIDREFPELQVSIPGRLDPEDAAVLGSAVLLATEKGVEYDERAFCTTQDTSTGARIMAYDAGGPRVEMPFMTPLEGRTDMLGRRSLNDIELYQLLGTVLIQAKAESGPFAQFADEFKERYRIILEKEKYGLDYVLKESWIYLRGQDRRDNKANQRHYETIKACSDAYFKCARNFQKNGILEGIIFEVRILFDWLREKVSKTQNELYDANKPCSDMRILLNF